MKRGVTLDEMDLSPGKRTRLHRLLYGRGPGAGRMVVLPIDQGLEHGPRDFFINPESLNPEFQLRLAVEGNFSAIALQIGLADKYLTPFAGRIPLILKINGKTEVPPDDEAFSPLTASVEDAVRLGADAVGYTSYIGSPAQDRDFAQFARVRQDAERYGLPTILWAYPRGKAMEAKGGRESFYAVDYAARVAQELGADIVKLNFPKVDEARRNLYPKPYNELRWTQQQMVEKVVASAGKTLVLISGGAKKQDTELLQEVKICFDAGVTGLIFGRNMWQRKFEDALKLTAKIHKMIPAGAPSTKSKAGQKRPAFA